MAYYDRVPAITVMQRLFVDRWWTNGGNIEEAIIHAGYEGLPTPSEKVKKGKRLLSNKYVQEYVGYLKEAERIARKREAETDANIAAARHPVVAGLGSLGQPAVSKVIGARPAGMDRAAPGGSSGAPVGATSQHYVNFEGGAVGADPAAVAEGSGGVEVGSSPASDGSNPVSGGSNPVFDRRPASRAYQMKELGARAAGTLLPPTVLLPANPEDEFGPELTPPEVRRILASVARGNEPGMKDARSRLRALELGMRNLGMLVDLSLKGTVDATPAKQLTSAERQEKIAELEGFLEKVKAKADSK